ncbi:MAG: Cna B-type domain-containing protein, partial [Limosilactobacillus fermentum]|nr:Cna B-type domain-containing protein [Limosilactobacillus fermentum]
VSGTKTWKDNDDQDGKRPDSIKVNLLANGKVVQSKTVTASDNWKYSFTNLPEFENGQKISYTVTEDQVKDYSTTVDGYNLTNSYTPAKTSVSVTKAWNDNNNQDGSRPK